MAMLQVSLPDTLKEKLRWYCFTNQLYQTDIVKTALLEYFEKIEKEKVECPTTKL